MADLNVTEAQVAVLFPLKADIHTMIAAVAITAGQLVYQDANGKADLADASVAGTANSRGLALQSAGAGQPINILKEGHVGGFTITQAYDAPLYTSNNPGAVADAAGTVSDLVGSIVAVTDKDLTKAVYIDLSWND